MIHPEIANVFAIACTLAASPLAAPDRPGPWDNDVLVYRAGADMQVEKIASFPRAGVPTLARLKDGRLIAAHQHFPENDEQNFDKVAVRFSSDEGKTWTKPEVIRLKGLPDAMRFPFDPTLVPLPDGGIRLYFTSLRQLRFEPDRPAIYSAISTNGIDYIFEAGMRFGIEGRPVIDCAVVLHKGSFHLFAPDSGAGRFPGEAPGERGLGYHATSKDGLNFTRSEDVRIDSRFRWLGNVQSDGKTMTFFGTADPGPPNAEKPRSSRWMATSSDGSEWKSIESPPVMGGDPAAIRTRDGGLLILITGAPRPGTPSAMRRKN